MRRPGLFIGRFQPLHNGHLHAFQEMFAQEEQVFIVIGSAQAGHTPRNPFTTAERILMVQSVLEDLNIPCSRYLIIPVPDAHDFRKWVNHVKQFVPPFGIVYSGSEITQKLFSKEGLQVKKIRLFQKRKNSGKEIRRRINQGEDWKTLVPRTVVELIHQFDGVHRVKSLTY